MTRAEIVAALREAIVMLEAGESKAAVRPRLERRVAEAFTPATDEERRSFRAGLVRYWKERTTRAGAVAARVGVEWTDSKGAAQVEYFDCFDESIINSVGPLDHGTAIQLQLKPWKDTFVIIGLTVTAEPPSGGCGFDPKPEAIDENEIPF